MTLNETLQRLSYSSIVKYLSKYTVGTRESRAKLKQLRLFYHELSSDKVPTSVINAVVLFAMRVVKDGVIPSNKYLHQTYQTNFKHCKNEDDAAVVFAERFQYEIKQKEIASQVKKVHQNKQSMTQAVKKLSQNKVI